MLSSPPLLSDRLNNQRGSSTERLKRAQQKTQAPPNRQGFENNVPQGSDEIKSEGIVSCSGYQAGDELDKFASLIASENIGFCEFGRTRCPPRWALSSCSYTTTKPLACEPIPITRPEYASPTPRPTWTPCGTTCTAEPARPWASCYRRLS